MPNTDPPTTDIGRFDRRTLTVIGKGTNVTYVLAEGGGVVGTGGYGEVYLAIDPDGRQVAVKMLRDDLARDPDQKMNFEREAALASRVESSRVVRVLQFGYEQGTGRACLVMEHMAGGSLAMRLADGRPLLPDEASLIIEDISGGLADIHAAGRGIAHGDLKPANVLVAKAGSGDAGHAKITDFGVATSLAPNTIEPSNRWHGPHTHMRHRNGSEDCPPINQTTFGRPAWSSFRCSAANCRLVMR